MSIINLLKNTEEEIILSKETRIKLLEEIENLRCKKEHIIIIKNDIGHNVVFSLNRNENNIERIDSYDKNCSYANKERIGIFKYSR